MENISPAVTPRSVLIETPSGATHDISQLVALTRITEVGMEKLQARTGTMRTFTYSAVLPDRTRTGVTSFKLENPDTAAIFDALKAAGRQVAYLASTGEIAPTFPENGVPASGQPHLSAVREWTYTDDTPSERRGFKSAATVTLADGRKTDVYFVADRKAFVPQNSVVLRDGPSGTR